MGKKSNKKNKEVKDQEVKDQEVKDQEVAEKETDVQEELTVEEQLREREIEIAELKDKYLRIFAEFDNFKKRTIKEKMDFMRNASRDVLADLLPVLDDFDRAKQSAEDDKSTEQFSEGVTLVYNKILSVVKSKGLRPMDSTGEVFDPELHEAITKIPAPSEDMKGKVIDTITKGYYLNDTIIRFAKVVVGE